jgi:hypothetical protein
MGIDWKRKLSSRKFWAMLANTVTQFGMLFGMSNSTAERITNIIAVTGGFIGYMIAEAISDTKDVIETINPDDLVYDPSMPTEQLSSTDGEVADPEEEDEL